MLTPYRDCFHHPQSPFPDTALSAAFLKALVHLVARRPDHFTKITLPTGPATIHEIARALRNLNLTHDRTPALKPNPKKENAR
jgi:hypothetical protein